MRATGRQRGTPSVIEVREPFITLTALLEDRGTRLEAREESPLVTYTDIIDTSTTLELSEPDVAIPEITPLTMLGLPLPRETGLTLRLAVAITVACVVLTRLRIIVEGVTPMFHTLSLRVTSGETGESRPTTDALLRRPPRVREIRAVAPGTSRFTTL